MPASSLAANWALRLGCAALALLAIGPLLNQLGVTPPMGGFMIFAVGLLIGVVALAFSIVGILRTGASSGRTGRSQALAGLACGGVVIAVLMFAQRGGSGAPPINDITTDTADPPQFVAILDLEQNRGRDMSYPGEEFAAQQRAGYGDLSSIEFATPPAQALAEVRSAAEALGWEVVSIDPSGGRLEATHTTAIFRFVDDVVVRVRPHGAGSLIDVRSKSRDGRGDIGANAARIRSLRDQLAR
jgi:uncharacterized protein (DUF1499 family)